ncbi:MAG TPA: BlaI/MecI/CopY family transcriptional regulator [Candidatus Sulfotelmatobacter sp.]|nr:BlaI/MecI/CopY family transcriptional regulator [Candidatus Sulfotelmatobacter sp.]
MSLNQNELEALRILWDQGELKPSQIGERFGWPIENATLRSVLVNLVEKKQIHRRRLGKAYYYSARVPKATMLQGMMETLKRIFAAGSSHALVAQLVETGDIKPSDLEAIREVAKKSPANKSKKSVS